MLGGALFEAGEMKQAEAVLTEGAEMAAAAGQPATRARIHVLLADLHNLQDQGNAETLTECGAATARARLGST